MKNRPWISVGFVLLAALSFAVILVLASFGGALNRTSDGAYAPMPSSPSTQTEALLFSAYFAAGALAAFTSKREGRVLWAVSGHIAIFALWGAEVFFGRDKGERLFGAIAMTVPFMAIPSFLWGALLSQKEDEPNQTPHPTTL